jgi:Zn-dependent M28 family amino/carboxypeptidase
MITKRRQLLIIFWSLVLLAGAFAQQSSTSGPKVDRLQQIIGYLASDALEGRRTGTQGANDAAHYIAGEFSLLGLRPGLQMARPARTRGENRAQFLQPFPFVSQVELGKNNKAFLNADDRSLEFRVGEDWIPLGFSSNAQIEDAEVAFVGYGISASELKYEDYDPGVRNRIAIAFSGTPDGDNPHGQFARAGEIRFKAAAARSAGARALLIISTEPKLKEDRFFRLSYDNAGEAGIPVVIISREMAAKILENEHSKLSDYENFADARTAMPTGPVNSDDTTLGNAVRRAAILRLPFKNKKLSISADIVRRETPSFNVVGILPGSDPKLKSETIVIGAHYDHLGRGGEGSLAPSEGEIHHGADDNASGVAGLIELARLLSTQNPKPRRTIIFIAFSGEEEGLIGSSYYVSHPVVPLANTVAMINMDMIGRLKDQKLIVGGVGTAQEWRDEIKDAQEFISAPRGLPPRVGNHIVGRGEDLTSPFALTLNEDGYGPSDHSSFYAKQVPVLFFWTGNHDDYHKPSDTADKINYAGEARIVSLVERIVRDIDKNDKRPTYTVAKSDSQGRSLGFRVYLGTIPNYADSNDGLKLDGVRDDSPASKAGLKAGDKIVKMAGREVKNVYDYTYALGEMKAGQEYEVELIREGQRLKFKITPEARK